MFSFLFFWLIGQGIAFHGSQAITLAMTGISALFAVLPGYISGLFETKAYYTGISLDYGIGTGLLTMSDPAAFKQLLRSDEIGNCALSNCSCADKHGRRSRRFQGVG